MDYNIFFPRLIEVLKENKQYEIELTSILCYLKYSKMNDVDKLYELITKVYQSKDFNAENVERIARKIAYAYGIYYEIFGFTSADICSREVRRQLKMRISPLFVKYNFGDTLSNRKDLWVLACGLAEDGFMVIDPFQQAYKKVIFDEVKTTLRFFQLNVPGMSKPHYIKNGLERFGECLDIKSLKRSCENCMI